MKTRHVFSVALLLPLSLLGSCASNQNVGHESWGVKPVFSVRHAGEETEAFYQLGRYYQGQKRYEQAIEGYLKALEVNPAFTEARNGLGVVYSLQGQYAEAVGQFKLALSQAPRAAHIHNNLGYVYFLQELYAEAVAELDLAVKMDPSNQGAHNNLGMALARAGEKAKAMQAFDATASLENGAKPVMAVAGPLPQAVMPAAVPVSSSEVSVQAAAEVVPSLPRDNSASRQVSSHGQIAVAASQPRAVQLAPGVYELQDRRAELSKPSKAVIATVAVADLKFRLEVSNGNGITGMARQVAQFLGGQGYVKGARLTNQKTFAVPSSAIRYRKGYLDEARLLQGKLPEQLAVIQSEDMRQDISVQIVLGRDMASSVAYFGGSGKKVRVAGGHAGS